MKHRLVSRNKIQKIVKVDVLHQNFVGQSGILSRSAALAGRQVAPPPCEESRAVFDLYCIEKQKWGSHLSTQVV